MKPLSLLLLAALSAAAQDAYVVPANRVITLAGQPFGTRSANNSRSAPADSPIPVTRPLTPGQGLQFSVTGAVDSAGPDGRPTCNDSFVAEFSITRVNTRCRALVGLFLADTTRPQPAAGIDFTGDAADLPILRPLIQQPFLIGSGRTSTGDRKTFIVPPGATRLFLAPIGLPTSTGEFRVTVESASIPETPANPVRVSGVSVINLAGQPAGTYSNNNARIAPYHSPALADVPLNPGQALRIVATGAVDGSGPDGRTTCTDSFVAEFSVARVDTRCRALVGVFMGDTLRAQPPNLNFTGALRNNVRVEPLLQQPFLIGSGYTDAGELKQFIVPSGATRLYFASVGNTTTPGFFTVTVSPEAATTPTLQSSSIVRAAGFSGGSASAGSIVSLFGANFAAATDVASAVPLPTRLGQTRVYFNLRPAPLFFTSSGQVNAQIPWEFAQDTTVSVTVVRNGAAALPVPLNLTPAAPGIFVVSESNGVVVNAASGQLVNHQSPARPGDVLVVYASGLGPVDGDTVTGAPASGFILEPTREPVEALWFVNGQSSTLPVLFAGSAPGFIGVNQVNIAIPATAPTGPGTLSLRTRNAESNAVRVAIQP